MSDKEMLQIILDKITDMDNKLSSVDTKVSSMETRMTSMETRMTSMETRMTSLEAQVSENTQILKALEHNAEVNRSEHDRLFNQLAKVEGLVSNLDDKFNRLAKDLTVVEAVAGKNMQDIAHLKAIK